MTWSIYIHTDDDPTTAKQAVAFAAALVAAADELNRLNGETRSPKRPPGHGSVVAWGLVPSFCKGARRHPARESYDSRVRNLRAVALFAATGASVALIGAPIAAADNGPGQPQCSGPPGACPTYGPAPINNSPPTRPPALFAPYDGARYPYPN